MGKYKGTATFDAATFGSRLRRLRIAKEMSQEELGATLANPVIKQTVSKWEAGTSSPTLNNLVDLSRKLRVSIDYLVAGEEFQPHATPAPVNGKPPGLDIEQLSLEQCVLLLQKISAKLACGLN